MKIKSRDMKIKKYNYSVGIAFVIAILFLSPSDSFGQFQMANTLVPLTGNDYPIIYANDAKGGHHQVTRLSARDSITSQRRQVGMLCTVYDGVTAPVTYQLICADTKAARDNNANWVVFTPGGAASSVAWSAITANPFNITTPLQGQLLSYDGTSSSWLNVNQPTIPLSGFGAATADVLLGGFKISNLADPASAQDAATKNYVDAASLTTSTAVTALITDSATIQPRLDNIISSISGKLNISDTAAMLANSRNDMNTLLNLKANLISPGFTGNPTAPTVTKGDSSTNLATTAFVSAAVSSVLASGGVLYQGTAADLSTFNGLTWSNITAATVLGNSIRGTICALSTTGYTWVACPVIWGEQKFFLSYGGQTYPFIDGIQKRVFPALTTGSVDYQVWIFKTTPDIAVNLIVNN